MNRRTVGTIALATLVAFPLFAQKTTRVQHLAPVADAGDWQPPSRCYLGVGIVDVQSDRVQSLKLKDDRGVEITQVDQDAPAAKAGLKEHDVIVAFNGTPVESAEQFKRLIRETPAGRTVSLDLMRDGQQQNVKVQLADRKKFESSMTPSMPHVMAMAPLPPMTPDFPRFSETITRTRSNSGLTLETLTPQLGDFFGVKNGEGMLVRSVQKGSPADVAGVRAGDVVVRVGDQRVTDVSDWNEALRNTKDTKVNVVVLREKKELSLPMTVPPRRSADSSSLATPVFDIDDVAVELADIGPIVLDGIDAGLASAADTLVVNQDEINREIQKAIKRSRRELIENKDQINKEVARQIHLASAKIQANSKEMRKALQEAQRALQDIHVEFGEEMQ